MTIHYFHNKYTFGQQQQFHQLTTMVILSGKPQLQYQQGILLSLYGGSFKLALTIHECTCAFVNCLCTIFGSCAGLCTQLNFP